MTRQHYARDTLSPTSIEESIIASRRPDQAVYGQGKRLIETRLGMRIRTLAVALAFATAASAASADPVADFYRGKQLKFIIRANPGGNYDLYMRLLARHLVKHVPGNPVAVPMNMPGGGGLTSLNYFDKVAPHDGTALTMVTQTQPMDQALGLDKSNIDMRKLNWIGNMSDENLFLVTRRNSATKMLEDGKRRETTLAATGAAGVEVMSVSILNQFLGTRFKNIIGYRSSPEMNLAMERGEVEGRVTTNLRALFATTPAGAAGFNVIIQIGMKKNEGSTDTPLLRDLARDANEKLAFDFTSRTMALARPVATNDNVPPERVAALRTAFMATMKDPDFLAEAKLQDLDISPWSGAELEQVVADIINSPATVTDQIRSALQSDYQPESAKP
jgi:tripartite-type tricarboxylate transporter receptor subunit TctC